MFLKAVEEDSSFSLLAFYLRCRWTHRGGVQLAGRLTHMEVRRRDCSKDKDLDMMVEARERPERGRE